MSDQRAGGIAWTDETWNPVRGCTRISPGCVNCYAEKVAARFSGPGLPYEGLAKRVGGEARWTGAARLVTEHLADPLRWRRPRRVFVNSMSDLFHEGLPVEDIAQVFAAMALGGGYYDEGVRGHTFQVLTKRAARMRDVLSEPSFRALVADNVVELAEENEELHATKGKWPLDVRDSLLSNARWWPLPCVWLGVSVEDQANADARIPHLLETPAAVRFVSYEPALGPVDFTNVKSAAHGVEFDALHGFNDRRIKIDWVIVGGESGRGARPFKAAWARSVVAQCRTAGVAPFVKQLGARPEFDEQAEHWDWLVSDIKDSKGGDPAEWPADLRVQEFPQVPA